MSWEKLGRAKGKGGLGFRGFSEFKKALLGKLCWRLMSNEHSLLSQVFKSRYFPRTSFSEAHSGYQPSYAWRSLCNAKSVIDLGLRWSIGNGQQVRIWKDHWLPELSSFKVWSPVHNLHEDAVVADLIDVDLKQWKRALVLDSFNEFEAK